MKKLFVIFLLLFNVACTTKKKELKVVTAEDLYNISLHNFNKKFYHIAAEGFEEIGDRYVFTQYANKSMIMAAYSYYKAKDYDDSLKIIDFFKKINFDSSNLEYIFYLEILNKSKQIEKSKKDLAKVEEALQNIDDFFHTYKKSKYEDDLLNKKKFIIQIAIENELNIATFYISQNNLVGAINHLNNAMNKYPISEYTPEILYRIYNLYRHINYEYGYKKYYEILKNNYSNTKWFRYATNK
jgi:outer membrane protein assembly factor BamD